MQMTEVYVYAGCEELMVLCVGFVGVHLQICFCTLIRHPVETLPLMC